MPDDWIFTAIKAGVKGRGRGNWGHSGRPGEVGGSGPSTGSSDEGVGNPTAVRAASDKFEQRFSGQVRAIARIYDGEANIPPSQLAHIVVTADINQDPELAAIAPHRGSFQVGRWNVKRVDVDQLKNIYAWKDSKFANADPKTWKEIP